MKRAPPRKRPKTQKQRSMVLRVIQWWDQWITAVGPPHALAILRILLGLFLMIVWITRLRSAPMLLSRQGLITPEWPIDFSWIPVNGGVATILVLMLIVVLGFFTVGFATRVMNVISFLIYLFFWGISYHVFHASCDRLFLFLLFVLMFSNSGATLSLDAKIKHGSFLSWRPISLLPQRIIALQITATYIGVGWQKLILSSWQQGGEILIYGFIGRWATPFASWFLHLHFPMELYDVTVFLVMFLEVTLPIALWIRRLQPWAFAAGLLFHILISVFLGIWWFLAMPATYILFLHVEVVKGWIEAVAKKFQAPKASVQTMH